MFQVNNKHWDLTLYLWVTQSKTPLDISDTQTWLAHTSFAFVYIHLHTKLPHLHPYSWAVKRHLHSQHFNHLSLCRRASPSISFSVISLLVLARGSRYEIPPPPPKKTRWGEMRECGRPFQSLSSISIEVVLRLRTEVICKLKTLEKRQTWGEKGRQLC